ncbi:MAG: GNAT family N-acetyltransferase [Kofleriaceae bacterium]
MRDQDRAEAEVVLRPATEADVPVLEAWDRDPDVIGATTDDADAAVAFGDHDWRDELAAASAVSYHLIAEVGGRPIGAMQIIDPHLEPTHYWGDIEPGLRAIDIWIGAAGDRGQGHGQRMMQLAHDRCFADPTVSAIVIDPLASNTRAIAFYHRLGYADVGRRRFGADDCVVMRLPRGVWARGVG